MRCHCLVARPSIQGLPGQTLPPIPVADALYDYLRDEEEQGEAHEDPLGPGIPATAAVAHGPELSTLAADAIHWIPGRGGAGACCRPVGR